MKFCPKCGKNYETAQVFCNADGAALIDAAKTISKENKNNTWLIYCAVGVSGLIIIGGIFAWFWMRTSSQTRDENIAKTPIVENENLISGKLAAAERRTSDLTVENVQNLIEHWEKAQDARNFADYRSCYAKSFKGVKTTLKGSREFDYDQWMQDRRLMFDKAVGLDVDIKNLQISVDGETATAEFDQYYRSLNYSDWGPKILKVESTPEGAKINYELLRKSNPL